MTKKLSCYYRVRVVLCLAAIVCSAPLRADDVWRRPFDPDEHTVVLYHFDEGTGNETHDALEDKSLTLRANKRGLWGRRDGFGATVRFERKDDDPNLLVGPANHDKLHLRHCTNAWTVEAWVKYEGHGGLDSGRTALNLCGTDDEGFSLPTGLRGGWSFGLHSKSGKGTLDRGITPWARFMGSPRGKDPNHDHRHSRDRSNWTDHSLESTIGQQLLVRTGSERSRQLCRPPPRLDCGRVRGGGGAAATA